MEELQRFGNSDEVQLKNFKYVIFEIAFPAKPYDEKLLMRYFDNDRILEEFAKFKARHGGDANFKHVSIGEHKAKIVCLMKSMRKTESGELNKIIDEAIKAALKELDFEGADKMGCTIFGGSIKKRTKRNRRKNRSTRIKKNRRKSRT